MTLENSLNERLAEFIDNNYNDFSEKIRNKLLEIRWLLLDEIESPVFNKSVENKAKQMMLQETLHRLFHSSNIGLSVQITDKNFKRRVMVLDESKRPLAEYLSDNADSLWNSIDVDYRQAVMSIIHEEATNRDLGRCALNLIFNEVFEMFLSKFDYLKKYATS